MVVTFLFWRADNQMEVNAGEMVEGVAPVNDLNLSDLPENLVSEHILEAPVPYAMEADMVDSDYVWLSK